MCITFLDLFRFTAMRSNEIQLKNVIGVHPLSQRLPEEYRDLYASEFYGIIKSLKTEQEFEDLAKRDSSFLERYQNYIINLEHEIKVYFINI